jgi:hypothetical protein
LANTRERLRDNSRVADNLDLPNWKWDRHRAGLAKGKETLLNVLRSRS